MKNNKGLISRYKLSKAEHEKIYELIKKMVFYNVRPVNKPTAVIVGGQPGSGKGSLIGYSKSKFNDDNVVIITTDDYKPFHPNASEIAKKFPTKYAAIVEADSALWTNEILQEAIESKYNFIFEVTLRNERILRKMKILKENGFQVIVRGIAVPYIESLLSAYERYEKQVEARNWGRFFNPEKYNKTYENIPNTIDAIEKRRCYDALEIYTRGEDIRKPKKIYGIYSDNYKKDNNIQKEDFKFNTAKEAIIDGRNTKLNISDIKDRLKLIENAFNRRQTTNEEKERLEILKNIVDNYI